MNTIKYLVGSEDVLDLPFEPYSEKVCTFLTVLSDILMKDIETRKYSDIVSFAFWCRKANIIGKKNEWNKRGEKRLGRGLVFHIAPSNIPINFAFTYIFSLLAGNANIVRVPSKEFPQVTLMCQIMKELLEEYPEINSRTAFVQYPSNDEITEQFSREADVRVVWGGDNTITKIRAYPAKPKCIDLVFADRYSICILDGQVIEEEDNIGLKKLAENFYNDTYLIDQNACSSPQVIFWKNTSDEAKKRFWEAIFEYSKPKYKLQEASCVDKYMKLCQDAINIPELKKKNQIENLIYHIELEKLPLNITSLRGSCGYFYEYNLNRYEELLPILTEKFQTITYYGVDAVEIQKFLIENHVKGIDRIVPVGKSLDIDVIWDGYDIISMLSRIIEVK